MAACLGSPKPRRRLASAGRWPPACPSGAMAPSSTRSRPWSASGSSRSPVAMKTRTMPTHWGQEGTAYHGYYKQHMYHPLLIFDGETDQLITALLRPGTAHASRGVVSVLRVLVPLLRARWPGVTIEIRADSGCAVPTLYTFCERSGVTYTIGLIPNGRLEALAVPLLAQAQAQQAASGAKVRLVDETTYQAGTWERA